MASVLRTSASIIAHMVITTKAKTQRAQRRFCAKCHIKGIHNPHSATVIEKELIKIRSGVDYFVCKLTTP